MKFNDSRIVEKILVRVLESFKVSITTLKITKDLSRITLRIVNLIVGTRAKETY